MNETITPRQARILNVITALNGVGREEIRAEIEKTYRISKPTLIRDLNILQKQKRIKSAGKGPLTKYHPFTENPLLKEFDIDAYFSLDPDERKGKRSFDFIIFDYFSHIFTEEELTQLDRVKKSYSLATSRLDPSLLKRELERFTIELAWKSSKIEGNTYTLLETESLIKEQKEAKGKTKDEAIMILNHKEAFDEIVTHRNDFMTLSLSIITQLHNVLVKDLDVTIGIRKQAVGITGTTYVPLDNEHQIREAFERTITMINKTKDAFEKAFIAHVMIAYIQPYADGNKRTARMLTNAILLANDLYPLSYRSVDEDVFKKALIVYYEQGSICEIKRLFIEQVQFANETYFR
jgi:fido (protein-threonine AMPylation protein)